MGIGSCVLVADWRSDFLLLTCRCLLVNREKTWRYPNPRYYPWGNTGFSAIDERLPDR
ncbi:Uncharacterised protein [Vibrio cholerae]|uniref:Uncharacterized protein n=1 Tax=Vibrio cholerae TaxID=666 RepID=A0A656AJG5_VIBCL|nr:Uncharacterised protein [Vibrio cholerae]CSD15244.1 Uncharacterised protein [Vibrio cholerae]